MKQFATHVVVLLIVVALPLIVSADEKKAPKKAKSKKTAKKITAEQYGAYLKRLVKDGKITAKEAYQKYNAFAKKRGLPVVGAKGKKQATLPLNEYVLRARVAYKGKGKTKQGSFAVYLVPLAGKKSKQPKSKGETIALIGERFRKPFQAYKQGDVVELRIGRTGGMMMSGKGMIKRGKGGTATFYSVMVGRLKSKDVELGEFTVQIDYITGIYGNRGLKDKLVGKTVKVVGVAGPWLDKLLLIRKGQTLKFRSGTVNGLTVSLSPKATVLEKAAPFDPQTYPVPPPAFRGFHGVVTGKIVSKSAQGYELIMRVEKVDNVNDGSRASNPKSIVGRLLELRGFYNGRYRKKFAGLRLGDRIQLGARHGDRISDQLEVTGTVNKAGK